MSELTQQGIAALKAGDRASARQLLASAVKQDPNDALAWLWLTGTVDSDEERLACLRQVLRIDPANQAASRGMAQIYERRAKAEAAQAQAAPPRPKPVPVPTPPSVERSAPEPARTPAPPPPETRSAENEVSPLESLRSAVELPPPVEEEAEAIQATAPAAARPAAEAKPASAAKPARKRAATSAESGARVIFRSRPSLVPALICFWLFLFGAVLVAVLFGSAPEGMLLAAGLGLILEIVVIYAVIRIMTVRYELTSQQLTLRFRGKRAQIPVSNIYHAELSQNTFQRLIGIGDIDIDASVGGELAHLRMRNVPECKMRTEQIIYLVKDHEPA